MCLQSIFRVEKRERQLEHQKMMMVGYIYKPTLSRIFIKNIEKTNKY